MYIKAKKIQAQTEKFYDCQTQVHLYRISL